LDEILSVARICKDIADLQPNILVTGITKGGTFLASHFKELVFQPKPDRLTTMLAQAQLMIGIPNTNKDFFGKVRFTMVCHDELHVFIFPLDSHYGEGQEESDCCILIMVVMPPYDHTDLVQKTLGYIHNSTLCSH
jgi:hypothetical protein